MRGLGHIEKVPRKGKREENRALICELCGTQLEADPESGEYRCPVCDITEE